MESGNNITTSKAEIDTSPPFRSVKEAVMLFGDKVIAHEVNANKIKENATTSDRDQREKKTSSELEITKKTLEKAREQSMNMSLSLSSLQQELEQTKRELQKLKNRSHVKDIFDLDMEDHLKYIDSTSTGNNNNNKNVTIWDETKHVTFSSPSFVSQLVPQSTGYDGEVVFQRNQSLKKKKKKIFKTFLPLIGGIFSKKKGSHE